MKETITFRISDDCSSAVEEVAKKSGLKISDIVRVAIRRFISDVEKGVPISLIDPAPSAKEEPS